MAEYRGQVSVLDIGARFFPAADAVVEVLEMFVMGLPSVPGIDHLPFWPVNLPAGSVPPRVLLPRLPGSH